METKAKKEKYLDGRKNNGKKRIDENCQNEILSFRCAQGTKVIWKTYAESLKLTETELFFRLIHHLGSQNQFIEWALNNPNFLTSTEKETNKQWIESWKLVARLSENIVLANPGRVKQVDDKQTETKTIKEVSEVLNKHFKRQKTQSTDK